MEVTASNKPGKKWKTRYKGKTIHAGDSNYNIGQKGSPKWRSYCARSKGIAEKHGNTPRNSLARRQWKCGNCC